MDFKSSQPKSSPLKSSLLQSNPKLLKSRPSLVATSQLKLSPVKTSPLASNPVKISTPESGSIQTSLFKPSPLQPNVLELSIFLSKSSLPKPEPIPKLLKPDTLESSPVKTNSLNTSPTKSSPQKSSTLKTSLLKSCFVVFGILLVFVIALRTLAGAASMMNGHDKNLFDIHTSQRAALGSGRSDNRIKRHLRTHTDTVTNEAEDIRQKRFLSILNLDSIGIKMGGLKLIRSVTTRGKVNALFQEKGLEGVSAPDIFKSEKFKDWVECVQKRTRDTSYFWIVKVLMTRFGDDKELLAALKQYRLDVAEGLLPQTHNSDWMDKASIKYWRTNKKSGNDVFDLLQLQLSREHLFQDKMFGLWLYGGRI